MRYITLVFLLVCISSFAQSNSNLIEEYFLSIRQNKSPEPSSIDKIQQMEVSTLCKLVSPHLNDSITVIRLSAYRLLHERGTRSEKQTDRQKIVLNLLHGWFDEDTGIHGFVASCLSTYVKGDFTSSAKDSISLLISKSPGYYDKLLRIAGFLQMDSLIPVLQEKLDTKSIKSERMRWSAYLALSRMGDSKATQLVLDKVKAKNVNDEVTDVLFPDLIYTRQRIAFDYLVEQLYSDQENCTSSNAERKQTMSCAYRIMEYLARVITNFPVRTDAIGELRVNNYEEALQMVRNWMKSNADLYIIDLEHL